MNERQPGAAIESILDARERPVGNVVVERLLPVLRRRHLGPFVFLDHLGPIEIAPGRGFDVPPHPHLGLSTVTYLFAGELLHRDSLGSAQLIEPGAINLMTAGKGVVHSERSPPAWRARGGTLHAAQLWLGLPLADEACEPSFAHHPAGAYPQIAVEGARLRVLFGEAFGAASPIVHPARPLLVDLELEPGASLELPRAAELGLCVIEGELRVGEAIARASQLMVFNPSAPIEIHAAERSRALLLGGPPLDGGERFIDWNFVGSSKARIERAKADWLARRFPLVPGDEHDFIPLHTNH